MSHAYSVNVMDEHVLRGNSGILKCHIPSFVSDFVVLDSWIDEEAGGKEIYSNLNGSLGMFAEIEVWSLIDLRWFLLEFVMN